MPENAYDRMARQHGAKSVMSLAIDDATLAAETARQVGVLRPLITSLLNGRELSAVDYGCGAGRFVPMLADIVSGAVIGYDPSEAMLAMHPHHDEHRVQFITGPAEQFADGFEEQFDIVFLAMVLGNPDVLVHDIISDLVRISRPGALFVLIDHMPDRPPSGRWWRFRQPAFYKHAFWLAGVNIKVVGEDRQLAEPMTIMAGRGVG